MQHDVADTVQQVSGIPELPPAGSTIRRTTARILPVDETGRVLLLHGWDPTQPNAPYWFTIGGAVEDGESLDQAAARELLEEAGINAEPESLGAPLCAETIEFDWNGIHVVQEQTFFAIRVEAPVVTLDGLDTWEQATIDTFGWWTPDELAADGGAAHPRVIDVMRLATTASRAL